MFARVHHNRLPRLRRLQGAPARVAVLLACLVLTGPVCRADGPGYYLAPEFHFADDLRQTFTLPSDVIIDINRLPLNRLRIIPGFNEDLALKVFRCRPFRDLQDMERRLPASLNRMRLHQVLTRLQKRLQFQ